MRLQVKVNNAEDIQRIFEATPKQAKKVLWFAIQRAATAARTQASKATVKQYHVKAMDVRNSMRISKKSARALVANIRSSGNAIPLIHFNTKPKDPGDARVFVKVKKKGTLRYIPKAFVKRLKSSGRIHVVRRVGEKSYPIEVLYGPSIPQMIASEDIMKSILERAEKVRDERLNHELKRLLRGEIT